MYMWGSAGRGVGDRLTFFSFCSSTRSMADAVVVVAVDAMAAAALGLLCVRAGGWGSVEAGWCVLRSPDFNWRCDGRWGRVGKPRPSGRHRIRSVNLPIGWRVD